MYSVIIDCKEIIPSDYIQIILNKAPKIWNDLKDLYKSQNYRDGKITDKELKTIFYYINRGLQIVKETDFEEFGVPYIFDIMKSENYGKGLISNDLVIKLIKKMCYILENDSFDDDRIKGRIDFGYLFNLSLIVTSKNYHDMMLTDDEIDLVLNEDDNDIGEISNGIDTAKMIFAKFSSISPETRKEIDDILDSISEDNYFFCDFFALLESDAFRKEKIKEEHLKLVISKLLHNASWRFDDLLELLNGEVYLNGLISDEKFNLLCKLFSSPTLEDVNNFYNLIAYFTSEEYILNKKRIIPDKYMETISMLSHNQTMDILAIFKSYNYAKGLIPDEYLNLIFTTEGIKLSYVLKELLTSECYAEGFITKEHLEMLVNEKYLAIAYMVERVLGWDIGEQEKYNCVLGLLNFDNKDMLCCLCDCFVKNRSAKDIKEAAYGYVDYNLVFPQLPKDNSYHVKKRIPNID